MLYYQMFQLLDCRKKVISENPNQKKLITTASGWFVGQVMQQTQGKANPKTVNQLLRVHFNL